MLHVVRVAGVAVVLSLALVISSCGAGSASADSATPESVATSFFAAGNAGDRELLMSLLTKKAREALESALHCVDIADNPFTHLRLGQSLRGLGMEKQAAAHLDIARRRGGAALLAREDPDYRGRAALAPQSSGRSVEQ